MNLVLEGAIAIILACCVFGAVVKFSIDRKNKRDKKLSKKQKRELDNKK